MGRYETGGDVGIEGLWAGINQMLFCQMYSGRHAVAQAFMCVVTCMYEYTQTHTHTYTLCICMHTLILLLKCRFIVLKLFVCASV